MKITLGILIAIMFLAFVIFLNNILYDFANRYQSNFKEHKTKTILAWFIEIVYILMVGCVVFYFGYTFSAIL